MFSTIQKRIASHNIARIRMLADELMSMKFPLDPPRGYECVHTGIRESARMYMCIVYAEGCGLKLAVIYTAMQYEDHNVLWCLIGECCAMRIATHALIPPHMYV
jgi:hypothetical protein